MKYRLFDLLTLIGNVIISDDIIYNRLHEPAKEAK
jgi:hypothetical protein